MELKPEDLPDNLGIEIGWLFEKVDEYLAELNMHLFQELNLIFRVEELSKLVVDFAAPRHPLRFPRSKWLKSLPMSICSEEPKKNTNQKKGNHIKYDQSLCLCHLSLSLKSAPIDVLNAWPKNFRDAILQSACSEGKYHCTWGLKYEVPASNRELNEELWLEKHDKRFGDARDVTWGLLCINMAFEEPSIGHIELMVRPRDINVKYTIERQYACPMCKTNSKFADSIFVAEFCAMYLKKNHILVSCGRHPAAGLQLIKKEWAQ